MARVAKEIKKDDNYEDLLLFAKENTSKTKKVEYKIGEKVINVEIKASIPFAQQLKLQKDVIDMIFVGDGTEIDDYQPCLRELAKRYAVVSNYTNLSLPAETNALWDVLYSTPIYDDVIEYVGTEIFYMVDGIDEKIKSRVNYLTRDTKINELVDVAIGFLNSLKDEFGKIEPSKFIETVDRVSKLPVDALLKGIINKTE